VNKTEAMSSLPNLGELKFSSIEIDLKIPERRVGVYVSPPYRPELASIELFFNLVKQTIDKKRMLVEAQNGSSRNK
jgi:hypothetical protein